MIVRLVTFFLWALAMGAVAFWSLRLTEPRQPWVPPSVAPPTVPEIDGAAIARLLGASEAPASASPHPAAAAPALVLTGVVAGPGGRGAALIAPAGGTARAYRVGQAVSDGLVLQSVRGRQALLGPSTEGPTTLTLEVTPLRSVTRAGTSDTPDWPSRPRADSPASPGRP